MPTDKPIARSADVLASMACELGATTPTLPLRGEAPR